jgi:hypothetical protein
MYHATSIKTGMSLCERVVVTRSDSAEHNDDHAYWGVCKSCVDTMAKHYYRPSAEKLQEAVAG